MYISQYKQSKIVRFQDKPPCKRIHRYMQILLYISEMFYENFHSQHVQETKSTVLTVPGVK